MKKRIALIIAFTMMCSIQAEAGGKLESIAVLMADYLTAGRIVIANNQPLFNDPAKGNKGFTPQVYEEQVNEEFMKRSGIDLKALVYSNDIDRSIIAIHESAKEVVAEAQPQINESGKEFKGFIPAVFGRRVGDKVYKISGITVKQTSLRYRGNYNKPDDFETSVLKDFESTSKGNTYSMEMKSGDTTVLRYMVPLYIEKSCLACHGEPAGEKDITGKLKEGYKEGDLRGAISVIVPLKCVVDNN
jgi:hypothetical protein